MSSSQSPIPIAGRHGTGRLSPLLLACGILSGGCATVQNPDPLEAVNRKTFAVNEMVDTAVLKPAARAYQAVVPAPVRGGVSNFLSNLNDPWSGINLALQGRVKEGLSDLMRFGTNSTVGLLGVMDVATDWGLPRHGDTFSDTLRSWGMTGGAYLVLPLLGPSDLRGVAAFPVNSMGSLQSQINDSGASAALTALTMVDKRSQWLNATQAIDDVALDKYLFVRDAYLQRRAQRERDAGSAEPQLGGLRAAAAAANGVAVATPP